MASERNASVWTQRIGIGVVIALVAVLALRVGSSSSQSVAFRDLTVWLPSLSTGEVVLAHAGAGAHGEVVARVKAAEPGEQFLVTQGGSGAVVLNRTKGEVGLIDGVTLTVSQRAPLPGVDAGAQLLWSDAGARVVTATAVHHLDRTSGVPAGTVALTAPIAHAVADATGTVYGISPTGQVIAVAAVQSVVPLATSAQPAGLVVAGGAAFVIDRDGPGLHHLEGAVANGRPCLSGAFTSGSTVSAGGSTAAGEQVVVVVDSVGGVRISDIARGTCSSLALTAPGILGTPAVAGGLVYLPVLSTGEIIVVNAAEGTTVGRPYSLGLPAGRAFELIEHDGTVWFNDPLGASAGVLGRDGVTVRVDKTVATADGVVGQGSSGGRGVTGPTGSGKSGSAGTSSVTGSSGRAASGATGRGGGTETEDPNGPKGTTPSNNTTTPGGSAEPNASAGGAGERKGLIADFTYSARSVKVGQPITFVDTSAGNPTAWTWEFGDGTFATGPKATHAWALAGSYSVTLRVENTTTSASASIVITVIGDTEKAKPQADFRFSASRVEVGQAVTFTDRSTGAPTDWQWSFGDGSGDKGATASHVYRAPGAYTVTLTATNAAGSDTSAPALVTVFDKVELPVAVIGGGASTANVGQLVAFSSRSTGNPTSISWTFGDGASASGASAQHAWTRSGVYAVTLQVSNSAGSATATSSVTVSDLVLAPVSRFTVSQSNAEEGQGIRFQSLSINNPTQLTWDFNDGSPPVTGGIVTHAYTRPGSFAPTLRAENSAGADVSTQQITVVAQLPAPVAAFSFAPNSVTTNTAVVFTDESSGGAATSWSWDFGDGAALVAQRNPTHMFERVGTYVVRLSVTNAKGTSVAQRNVTVLPSAPEPSFSFTPATPQAGAPVQFSDTSGGGVASSWLWNFGDNATSTQRNPAHTFAANGSYDVRLTVSNASGSAFVVRRVDVNPPPPVSSFTFAPIAPTTATPVVFTNTSSGGSASTIRWDFGDSSPTSGARSPSHGYDTPGTYTVRLTMANVTGSSSSSETIAVTVPPPVASFTVSTPAVAGSAVSFTNTSQGGPFSATTWDFGDSSAPSSAVNPTHVYAAAGTYTVRLTEVNSGGTASITAGVRVVAPIVAAFTISSPRVAGQAITFTNTTTGGPFTSFVWDFGDSSATASGATTSHTYSAAGPYVVTLSVVAASGATDDKATPITVAVAAPVAAFTFAPAASPARTMTFSNTSTGSPFTTVTWDFGDGSPTGSGATVIHTFGAGTSFDVKLTVTNATATSNVIHTVAMVAPTAGFTFSNGTAARSVDFTSTSSGAPFVSVTWDFGDASPTGSGASPTHVYTAAQTYTVKLTVVNAVGTSSVTHDVVVT